MIPRATCSVCSPVPRQVSYRAEVLPYDSVLFVRLHHQAVGHEQRLEKHPDIARPRPLDLFCAIHAERRHDRQRESRSNDPDMGGVQRVSAPPSERLLGSDQVRKLILFFPYRHSFCVKTISGHNDWIRSALPSSDGSLLITCSVDQVRVSRQRVAARY